MSDRSDRIRTERPQPVLGDSTARTVDALESIEAPPHTHLVRLHVEHFTSLCPVTGQPDAARMRIAYAPDGRIAETKSVKLWLQRWRDVGEFNEVIASRIAEAFREAIGARWCEVTATFAHRGGIAVEAVARAEATR